MNLDPSTDAARRLFANAMDSSPSSPTSPDRTPLPWEDVAAAIARSHPQYRVTGYIGKGGMGAVYSAENTKKDGVIQHVAVKVLRHDACGDPGHLTRFQRETAILRSLNHPSIVTILDIGETADEHHFFTMPLLSGETLAEILKGPRLREESTLAIMECVCHAIAHAHRKGVIHRDIKPANIFVNSIENSGSPVVTVLDFGIARERLDPGATFTLPGHTPGTLGYIAPEVAKGQPAGFPADIFALGVLCHELLTGGDPAVTFNPALEPVVAKAMHQFPGKRYQTADELIGALMIGNERKKSLEMRNCQACETLLSASARQCPTCGEDQLKHFPLNRWWQRRCRGCARPMSRFSKKCHHLDCLAVNRWAAFQTAPATALFMLTALPFFALYYSTPSATNPVLATLMFTGLGYRSIFYVGDYFTAS